MTLEAAKAALPALLVVLAHAAPLAAQTVVEALVDPAFIDCAATPSPVWTPAAASAAGNHVVRASDSVFAENGGDGLVILTNSGTPTPVTLAECRFMGNGGDGIEVSAPGAGGAVTVALWKNTIIQNAGAGLRDSGSNTSFPTTSGNNSACVNNLFGANASGNFVGFGSTPPCGNSASAAHADHESTF